MPDLTISDLKRALVEVKELCVRTECNACPLHKTEKGTIILYCPLYMNMDYEVVMFPFMWDIDDWKEDEHAQTD